MDIPSQTSTRACVLAEKVIVLAHCDLVTVLNQHESMKTIKQICSFGKVCLLIYSIIDQLAYLIV